MLFFSLPQAFYFSAMVKLCTDKGNFLFNTE